MQQQQEQQQQQRHEMQPNPPDPNDADDESELSASESSKKPALDAGKIKYYMRAVVAKQLLGADLSDSPFTGDDAFCASRCRLSASNHRPISGAFPRAASDALVDVMLAIKCAKEAGAVLPNPAAHAAAAALSPPAAIHDSHQIQLLLRMRAVSDHIVRNGPAFDALFPGQLVSEWQPEEIKYQFPISLVWMHDESALEARNSDQQLAIWQKRMPLIPMFTVGVSGDGDCLLHSVILSDSNVTADLGAKKLRALAPGDRHTVLNAARDPVFGLVDDGARHDVSSALAMYRATSVHTFTLLEMTRSQIFCSCLCSLCDSLCLFYSLPLNKYDPPMPASLMAQLRQGSAPIDSSEMVPIFSLLHDTPVRMARFDRPHESWLSDRCAPRGIVLLECSRDDGTPLPLLKYPSAVADALVAVDAAAAANSITPHAAVSPAAGEARERTPIFLLEYMAGTHALTPLAPLAGRGKKSKGAAAAGAGSPSLGHVQPLIPAPQWLLRGPQHPCFTMDPTLWVPFAATSASDIKCFLTPYHRGLFHSLDKLMAMVADFGPRAEHRPLFRTASEDSLDGAFHDVVHIGSVVAFLNEKQEEEQGVVVSTLVRMSASYSRSTLDGLIKAGLPEAHVLRQLFAEPTPIPYVIVLKLKRPASWDATLPVRMAGGVECWQELQVANGADSALPGMVRTSQISHVFPTSCLGEFGLSPQSSNLIHRITLDTVMKLPDPAAHSRLRAAVNNIKATRMVQHLLLQLEPAAAGQYSAPDFIAAAHQQASLEFPIDVLLSGRSRISCALELTAPGLIQQRQIQQSEFPTTAAAVASGGTKQPGNEIDLRSAQSSPAKSRKTLDRQAANKANAAFSNVAMDDDLPAASRKPRTARKGGAVKRKASSSPPLSSDRDEEAAQTAVANEPKIKRLFQDLADISTSERISPFSAYIMNQVQTEYARRQFPTGDKLAKSALAWTEEIWQQLRPNNKNESIDPDLFVFLRYHAELDSMTEDICAALAQRHWRQSAYVKAALKAQRFKQTGGDITPWFDDDGQRADVGAVNVVEKLQIWTQQQKAAEHGSGATAGPRRKSSRKARDSGGSGSSSVSVITPAAAAAIAAAAAAAAAGENSTVGSKRRSAGIATPRSASESRSGKKGGSASAAAAAAAPADAANVAQNDNFDDDPATQELLRQIAKAQAARNRKIATTQRRAQLQEQLDALKRETSPEASSTSKPDAAALQELDQLSAENEQQQRKQLDQKPKNTRSTRKRSITDAFAAEEPQQQQQPQQH